MDGSSAPLIFDISSDEDDDMLRNFGSIDSDYDWISELFPEDVGEKEKEKEGDDEDDVVVVSEVLGNPKKRKRVETGDYVDDDDDCVILEGDPDKLVEVENGGGGEEDDLVVVGEKGQIACRDYPHARHLCAKFPFASTPHKQHCQQCHCYVCDSLAPCIYWGNGSSNADHCHSTDQDPIWKAQRKNFKQGNKAPLPICPPPDTSLLPPLSQTISTPSSVPAQNQIGRLSAIRACSNSTISNLNPPWRSHSALHTHQKKYNTTLVSQQPLSSSSKLTLGNLGARYMNRPNILKRQIFNPVAPPSRRYGNVLTNSNYVPQTSRNPRLSANLSIRSLPHQHQHSATGSHSQQNYSSSSRGSVPPPSLDHVSSVLCQPQPLNNQFLPVFPNRVSSELSTVMSSAYISPISPLSQPVSQSNINYVQNQVSSQLQAYSQPYMGINNSENSIPSQSQALSQPNPAYSQCQTHDQPNYMQLGNDTQSSINNSSTNCFQNFPAENPLVYHQPLSASDYDSSNIHENTNNQYSYFPDPDPWTEGYVGTDRFDFGSSEATIVDTGPLFDYGDPVYDHPLGKE